MASLLNMSGGSLLGKGLPYDAEIEYLEATGTQWIDTGFKATNGCIFDFEAAWKQYEKNIVGSHNPAGNTTNGYNRNMVVLSNAATVKVLKCDNWPKSYGYTCSLDTKYHVFFNTIYRNIICVIDGNTIVNSTANTILNPVNNIMLFLNQYDNKGSSGKIYYCKLYDSTETIIRDFIPVRIGNVGYMYDKVSGQLFGNSGTGNFILGNDI